ncbi:hypothetical protein [Tropicimonas sp. IMCC34043]|uniref:hypothetical protein n=1 Tax=Tropicimonas sp. IMCC34043 TaxID=2248760 RepID=UPI000E256796|nr:hypothetical protein [Tropicimonas sp. IMCC34043]
MKSGADVRSTRSIVTFSNAFALPGFAEVLPAGDYELLVEEEPLLGPSFEAFRRTATYLAVHGKSGRTSMRPIEERDLEVALGHDRELAENRKCSDAALSPRKD